MKPGLLRLGLALALAACGPEDPAAPPTLPLPPAPPPAPGPGPPSDPDASPIGFRGVLPPPGTALTLHPGTEFVIPVATDADLGEPAEDAAIPLRVTTDAPPTVLTVPAEVTVRGGETPDVVRIRALAPEEPADAAKTYEVRLEPPPEGLLEFPGLSFRLEPALVTVRIAEPAPPETVDCARLSLAAAGPVRPGNGGAVGADWFGDLGGEYRSAPLRLRSPGGAAALRLVADYQQLPYGDFGEAYNLVPVLFALDLDLDLEARGPGFEQTLTLAWFDELSLRAAIPGCPPVELRCDDRGRCRQG